MKRLMEQGKILKIYPKSRKYKDNWSKGLWRH